MYAEYRTYILKMQDMTVVQWKSQKSPEHTRTSACPRLKAVSTRFASVLFPALTFC